jgi:hypothetical protein
MMNKIWLAVAAITLLASPVLAQDIQESGSWRYGETSDNDEKNWSAVNLGKGVAHFQFVCIGQEPMRVGLVHDKAFPDLVGSIGIMIRLDQDVAQDFLAIKVNDRVVIIMLPDDVSKIFEMIAEHKRLAVQIHSEIGISDYDFSLDGWMDAKQYLSTHCSRTAAPPQ